MSDFTIVPDDEFPNNGAGRPPSALTLALEAGHVVFVERVSRSLSKRNGYLGKRGFRTSQRAGTRDGVRGFYVRAFKNSVER